MLRIRSLLAMVLLAIWMPATLHCELELAGIIPDSDSCHERGKTVPRDDDADGCIDVEAGGYRIDSPALNVLPPDLLDATLVLVPVAEIATEHLDVTAAPLVIRRQWQFASRAALPAQAP